MSGTMQSSEPPVGTTLQLVHTTSVTPDQIDQLGHMNVRFYGVHALAGARDLVGRIGLSGPADSGKPVRTAFTDLYTRHYREQLEGSSLEVWGGVLDAGEAEMRMYFELRNPARDELAATFVFTARHQDADTRVPVAFADTIVDAASRARVAWPDHGRPRSVNLDVAPPALSIKELAPFNLSGRDARVIEAKDCDAEGVYQVDRFQDLVWGGDGIGEDEDWLQTLENGDKMGWATMESRCTLHELPRAGTRVQSYWAIVDVNRKAQHQRFWVYDIDREILLCTASFVDVAFNINTRRAIDIPGFERSRLDEHFHPELA